MDKCWTLNLSLELYNKHASVDCLKQRRHANKIPITIG